MKPAIMELGGHAPVIMCDDIDPISSAGTSAIAKSRNAGQVCGSPTRFFVEDAIYDRFADAFAEKAATIRVGNGLDPDNQMGPLANDRRLAAMETLVADAKAKGARITAGGSRIGNSGYFFPLTVLAQPRARSRRRIQCRIAWPPTPSRIRRATWTGGVAAVATGTRRGPAADGPEGLQHIVKARTVHGAYEADAGAAQADRALDDEQRRVLELVK